MNGLRRKLDLLKKTSGIGSHLPISGSPTASTAVAKAESDTERVRLQNILGGEFFETSRGPIHVTRHSYPQDQLYGSTILKAALELSPSFLSPLYAGMENFRIENCLFFDTETTGLSGGSGTYAFLVGIGYYQGNEFVTEQLMMRDHGDEPALLDLLERRCRDRSGLVSFNGKSFDAQLLSTRYSMHRLADPLAGLPHFDLLHLCRRLWRHSALPDCRLETLEHRVLGAPRQHDVPGWMIPDLFFQFLRDRDARPLKGVIEHNRRDLLAMVGLCGQLVDLLNTDHSAASLFDANLQLGLARLWDQLGRAELSDHLYRCSLSAGSLSREAQAHGLLSWGRALKKRNESEKAALLWRRLLAHSPGHIEATVELAKWLEHQRRDFRTALILVEGGLRDHSLTLTRRRELEHRALRLRRRTEEEAR